MIIINVAKHFYSILSTDFWEEEFWREEYSGLALTVFPSSRFARDYRIRGGGVCQLTRKKNASFCINISFSEAMTKTFQQLKQWQPTSIVSALSYCLMKVPHFSWTTFLNRRVCRNIGRDDLRNCWPREWKSSFYITRPGQAILSQYWDFDQY